MFENYKLNIYRKNLAGFAYELLNMDDVFPKMVIYWVLNNADNMYSFVKYHTEQAVKYSNFEYKADQYDAHPIAYWINQNIEKASSNLVLKKK